MLTRPTQHRRILNKHMNTPLEEASNLFYHQIQDLKRTRTLCSSNQLQAVYANYIYRTQIEFFTKLSPCSHLGTTSRVSSAGFAFLLAAGAWAQSQCLANRGG